MTDQDSQYTEEYSLVSDFDARIRILETKYSLVRERMFVINQNMIDEYKKLSEDMHLLQSDLKDLKDTLFEIKETTRQIIKELETFSKKEDVKVLEKYINFWNPLKFVTEKEVIDLIKKGSKKSVKKEEIQKNE